MTKNTGTLKAYQNDNFLNSSDGRIVRMLSEFLEPQNRFRKEKIVDTIVFFGSARLKSKKDATIELNKFNTMDANGDPEFADKLRVAQHHLKMSKYYEEAVQLSKKLTEWSLNLKTKANRFTICTGGGPGIMEAANKGAKLAGGKSIGLNISIPFEQFINRFVPKSLSFEFHYFFMRKFWFSYLSKTLVVFPGGFGTMDEFFEILTLVQTGKIKKKMLLIVYDEKYWRSIINFEGLVNNGVVSAKDLDHFTFCNNVEDTFNVITKYLESNHLVSSWKDEVEPELHLT